MGWNDAARQPPPPPSNPSPGCLLVVLGSGLLIIYASLSLYSENSDPYALLLGIAIVGGLIKGFAKQA
jgi:hypothetical protein